jgi:hypothetical protein
MRSSQIFSVFGAVLVLIGVFLHVIGLPVLGGRSLMQWLPTASFCLLILAAANVVSSIREVWWGLLLSKIGIMLCAAAIIIQIWIRIFHTADILTGLVSQATTIEPGMGVLFAGILMLSAAPTPPPIRTTKRKGENLHESPRS